MFYIILSVVLFSMLAVALLAGCAFAPKTTACVIGALLLSDYLLAPFRLRICYLPPRILTDYDVAAQLRPAIIRLIETTNSPPRTPSFAENARLAFDWFENCSMTNGFNSCITGDLPGIYYSLHADGPMLRFRLREKNSDVRLGVTTGIPGCGFSSKIFSSDWVVDGKLFTSKVRTP